MLSSREIREGLETKKFHPDGVVLGAWLGHPGAREIRTDSPDAPDDIGALLAGLDALTFESDEFRHAAIVRAAIAMARPTIPLAKKRRKTDYATAFHATESWALCPCSMCVEPLREECFTGLTPREPLELQLQYHVAGVALDSSSIDSVVKKCTKLLGKKTLLPAVQDELLGWVFREADPVRSSVGTRVTWWLNPREGDPGVRTLDLRKLDSTVRASLATAPPRELPVTRGKATNLLPNELGLLIASDAFKAKLEGIEGLDFVRTSVKSEPHWLIRSAKPIAALSNERHRAERAPVLDPNKVAKAPNLFLLKDAHLDAWLVERDFILGLVRGGLPSGIFVKAATYGCALSSGRTRTA